MRTSEVESRNAKPASVDPRKEGRDDRRGAARTWRAAAIALGCILVAGVAYGMFGNSAPKQDFSALPTATVKRDNLLVTVTEGGTLVARSSYEIKSQVEGRRTILQVVPEGTVITQKDVDEGMVLLKLDASELTEREGSREISYYNAEAASTKAKEEYDIQVKQNESNIAIAKLNVKFARMELERYVGAGLAERLLAEGLQSVDLGPLAEAEVERSMQGNSESGQSPEPAHVDGQVLLGGMARQRIREMSADVQLANVELSRARDELKWSRGLHEKKYISANELKGDELEEQRRQVALDAAEEALRLFLRYSLTKEVEQRLSDYVEAQRGLERAEARARSELAQAEAERRSRQASFDLEKRRLDELRETLQNAVIRAPRPGRVVYASTTDAWRRMRDPVREGKEVRQNETVLILPDLSTLSARVNIHETDVEKVKVGQRTLVTVEAMPGRSFPGKVASVSPVASAAQSWLNPDIKVYEVDATLDQVPDGLTPGMSATAEIVVADLRQVLQVPVEAISAHKGGHVCWVKTAGEPQMRPVECGYFTKKFVEIRGGLQEDDVVFLEPPVERAEEIDDNAKLLRGEMAEAEAAAEARPVPEVQTGAPEGEPAPPEQAGQSQYVTDGRLDWQKIRAELGGLSDEERVQKLQEIRNQLPAEYRSQLDQMGRGRQGRPGGGEGPRGAPNAQRMP